MTVTRRARAADIDVLLRLVGEFYEVDRHPYDAEVVTRGLGPLLVDDTHGQVWLIQGDDPAEAEGYAVVTWSWSLESGGRDCLLDELYVRGRGRGLGGAALDEVVAAAAAVGAQGMFLETEAHNERARGFYARHGFVAEDSIWMSRPLAGD